MIPADHITINGDTAWLVVNCPPNSAPAQWEQDDKSCGMCGGSDRDYGGPNPGATCPGCIDGRHMFEIEVEVPMAEWIASGGLVRDIHRFARGGAPQANAATHRVSIVPGMVLPIVSGDLKGVARPVIHTYPGGEYGQWFYLYAENGVQDGHIARQLPPAATPGMWAVKLRLAPENVDSLKTYPEDLTKEN